MRATVSPIVQRERFDAHIPQASPTVVVYDIVRQNTWNLFFGFTKFPTPMVFHPEPSGLLSKWHATWEPDTGYFKKEGMRDELLDFLSDYVRPQDKSSLR